MLNGGYTRVKAVLEGLCWKGMLEGCVGRLCWKRLCWKVLEGCAVKCWKAVLEGAERL